jgi:hypothetical protein
MKDFEALFRITETRTAIGTMPAHMIRVTTRAEEQAAEAMGGVDVSDDADAWREHDEQYDASA